MQLKINNDELKKFFKELLIVYPNKGRAGVYFLSSDENNQWEVELSWAVISTSEIRQLKKQWQKYFAKLFVENEMFDYHDYIGHITIHYYPDNPEQLIYNYDIKQLIVEDKFSGGYKD